MMNSLFVNAALDTLLEEVIKSCDSLGSDSDCLQEGSHPYRLHRRFIALVYLEAAKYATQVDWEKQYYRWRELKGVTPEEREG